MEGLQEVKTAVDKFESTFSDFKDSVEKELKELKDQGAVSPEREAELKKAAEDVQSLRDDVQAIVKEKEKTAELEKQLAEYGEELERREKEAETARSELKERQDKLETILKRSPLDDEDPENESQEKKSRRSNVMAFTAALSQRHGHQFTSEEGAEAYKSYVPALRKFLRKGDNILTPDEQKALSVGVDADGGYWVPAAMSDRVITRVFETSPMREIANVIAIGTDAIEFPTDTNTAVSGGWVGETESRAETATPQVGMARISTHEQYAAPRATQKVLDDAQIDVEAWLAMKIADILGRTETTAFFTGNGVNQPRGFLDYKSAAVTTADASRSWGVLQYRFTGASAAYDTSSVDGTASPADELYDVVADLKPIYRPNARWLMARATESATMKIKDANGNFVWQLGNIQAGAPTTLLGFPVTLGEDMPALAANSYSVAFGDFNEGYQIVDRIGIRTLRDPFSAKPYVIFYTTKRVGGDVLNFDAIKLLKFGTS